MSNYWELQTHGDPLGAVRSFMQSVWEEAGLTGLLVPPSSTNGKTLNKKQPFFATEPTAVEQSNPFTPLMTVNAAKLLPPIIKTYPQDIIGAVLRPCEHRALIEMAKRDSLNIDNLLTISFDCLGTFPDREYEWRAKRKTPATNLSQETMQFARQGGIAAYRYRAACQMCAMPVAQNADINIGVIGLPIRQHMLISTAKEDATEKIDLVNITYGIADSNKVKDYERMTAKIAERRRSTRERLSQALRNNVPDDIDNLITLLQECGDCQQCMDACPICSVEFPIKSTRENLEREDIMRWLISCAGCGMCEQACSNHLPLASIFTTIREQLKEETGYLPGISINDLLPIL
jgi:formate dehydrogenase subunit beta